MTKHANAAQAHRNAALAHLAANAVTQRIAYGVLVEQNKEEEASQKALEATEAASLATWDAYEVDDRDCDELACLLDNFILVASEAAYEAPCGTNKAARLSAAIAYLHRAAAAFHDAEEASDH